MMDGNAIVGKSRCIQTRSARVVSASLVFAFVLASCATGRPATPTPAISPIPSVPEATSGRQLVAAPDLRFLLYQGLDQFDGREPRLSALLMGEKPLVLNFWGGLCPPCRSELPEFQKVYEQYGDRVAFFGVDVGQQTGLGTPDDAKRLLQELNITYPAGSTTAGQQALRSYQVRGLPTTIFINADGKIVRSWTGQLSGGKLAEIVADFFNETPTGQSPSREVSWLPSPS